MWWMVDTMLAIKSLASESDVFVGIYLSGWVMMLGFQNFVPELNF